MSEVIVRPCNIENYCIDEQWGVWVGDNNAGPGDIVVVETRDGTRWEAELKEELDEKRYGRIFTTVPVSKERIHDRLYRSEEDAQVERPENLPTFMAGTIEDRETGKGVPCVVIDAQAHRQISQGDIVVARTRNGECWKVRLGEQLEWTGKAWLIHATRCSEKWRETEDGTET